MPETSNLCHACGREVTDVRTHECPADPVVRTRRPPREPEGGIAPKTGDVLAGRWELVAEVGAGGGGTVFRAHDRELGIDVALKVLHPERLTDAVRKRFRREIRVTRRIDHPCVARVFDLGESGSLTFLTMRWIDGASLQKRVAQGGPLPPPALRRLAQGLVSALAAAHREGVVHRDVKPANVLVAADGTPVLVDFGIASEDGSATVSGGSPSTSPDAITQDGVVPGTPAYMAPEQKRGEPTRASVDLFSMALTLSFAATGVVGRPEDPRRAFAAYGAPLAGLLARCLEESASRRPADAAAVEDALRRHGRTRRALVSSAIGGGLLLLGAAAAAVVPLGREPPARVHVESFENATGDPSLDWLEEGVRDLVAAGLESGGARIAERRGRDVARVRARVSRVRAAVALDLSLVSPDGETLARARIAHPAGEGLFRGVDRAVGRFLGALGIEGRRRVWRPPSTGVAAFVHYARAQELLAKHRVPAALGELREATRLDPTFALAQLQRAVLVSTGGYGPVAEGEAALERAVEHRDRLPAAERGLLDAVHGVTTHRDGAFDRLRAWLRAHPPESSAYFMAYKLAGGDYALAREILEEWIARLPDDPEPQNQLGFLLLLRFDDPEGAERALRAYSRLAPGEPNPHDSLADFLLVRGREREALEELDRALAIDPTFTSAAVDAPLAQILLGELDDADARLVRARSVVAPDSRDFSRLVSLTASIPLLRGDTAGAVSRINSFTQDPAVGSRAWPAHEWAAIVAALDGDDREARARAAEADRLHRLYHGGDRGRPSLAPYVEGLLAHERGDRDSFARALADLREAAHDDGSTSRIGLFEGLEARLAGDPARSAERFVTFVQQDAGGAAFLAILERARALEAAGRTGDALDEYDQAIARRHAFAATAEAAHEWRAGMTEASALARRTGDAQRATSFERRIPPLAPVPAGPARLAPR